MYLEEWKKQWILLINQVGYQKFNLYFHCINTKIYNKNKNLWSPCLDTIWPHNMSHYSAVLMYKTHVDLTKYNALLWLNLPNITVYMVIQNAAYTLLTYQSNNTHIDGNITPTGDIFLVIQMYFYVTFWMECFYIVVLLLLTTTVTFAQIKDLNTSQPTARHKSYSRGLMH